MMVNFVRERLMKTRGLLLLSAKGLSLFSCSLMFCGSVFVFEINNSCL